MLNKVKHLAYQLLDPRRLPELAGKRVVFHSLNDKGLLEQFQNKRILEIGPKHGLDSRLLADLNPSELMLIDLPSKKEMVEKWLPEVASKCKVTPIYGNLLYLSEEQIRDIGKFDLIFCFGVLYHNVEQIRLLKKLYNLCAVNGMVVVESATARSRAVRKLNGVEIYWPETYRKIQTVTHLPSRLAIKSWLEMVGFTDVEICDVYSKSLSRHRAVLIGLKRSDAKPYYSYSQSGKNPDYIAGEAV